MKYYLRRPILHTYTAVIHYSAGCLINILILEILGLVWWRMSVIPATWEAEAGESLEPRGRGCGEPRSRHCTPAWATSAKLHLKKMNDTVDFGDSGGSMVG